MTEIRVNQQAAVIPSPRRSAGLSDLRRMQKLLIAGRKAHNGTYYVHTGDLDYWQFYLDVDQELWKHTYLWEKPDGSGELDGWALLTPNWRTFDVFIDPSLRGSSQAEAMYAWAEERIIEIATAQGRREIYTIWMANDDQVMAAYLQERGFELDTEHHIQMSCSLDKELPRPLLPDGYVIRHVSGDRDGELRAAASYAAFKSSLPWDTYLRRYQRFMQSPVYKAEHDLVVASPDGRLASFCLIWLDEINKVGLFEPVGTHPDFHRLGLGKVLMLAGLQQMQAKGMQTAIVNTDHDNLPALGLYRSAGFHEGMRLLSYVKRWATVSEIVKKE